MITCFHCGEEIADGEDRFQCANGPIRPSELFPARSDRISRARSPEVSLLRPWIETRRSGRNDAATGGGRRGPGLGSPRRAIGYRAGVRK